ncbi:MAG TPA: DoxX family protein, partial [Verrucomicrobiae bacterium]|nr:DoxX family protein [Verrucomicrobiae bacterium]
MGENTKSNRAGQIVATGARWILGAVFIYMGMNKVLHPVDFLKLARQYQMTDSYFVLNAVAGALPWFEVFCGLLLVLGIAARGAALVTLGMLIPFTALVWHRAQ